MIPLINSWRKKLMDICGLQLHETKWRKLYSSYVFVGLIGLGQVRLWNQVIGEVKSYVIRVELLNNDIVIVLKDYLFTTDLTAVVLVMTNRSLSCMFWQYRAYKLPWWFIIKYGIRVSSVLLDCTWWKFVAMLEACITVGWVLNLGVNF